MTLTKFISRIDLSESRVDRENNIIKGVSLVSLGEARGHNKIADRRTLEQVRDCAKQYKSGLRVRFNPTTFNHGDAGLAGFIPSDTINISGDKVVGDLHVYRSYPNKDYLYEIAERAPDNFGLSIEFNGLPENINGLDYARCDEIFAATIVDLPAANPTGLWAADDKKPYGDVEYADPGYQSDGQHRYPINTADHVRAAWSYINQGDNSSKYSSDDLTKVKNKIKSAAKKFGIEINEGDNNMSMTDEQVTKLGGQIVDGLTKGLTKSLTPLFKNAFRMNQDTPNEGDPTDEEISAACPDGTDGMSDDDIKSAVNEYRQKNAKDGNTPVTLGVLRKELMQVFRTTGGKAAKSSAEASEEEKKKAAGKATFESLVTEFRKKNPDVSEATAVMEVRKSNRAAYNDFCVRGRPAIGK